MADTTKLKENIAKLKGFIAKPTTPKNLLPKFKAQLEKAEKELAAATPKKAAGRPSKNMSAKELAAHYRLKYKAPYGAGDIKKDADIPAMKKGKRTAKQSGKTYYEYRKNRTDKNAKHYPKLEDGGTLGAGEFKKGGKVAQNKPEGQHYSKDADKERKAKGVGWRWTNAGAKRLKKNVNLKPSMIDIVRYKEKTFKVNGKDTMYLYNEKRVDKSDISRRGKLEEGGTLGAGEFAKGGVVQHGFEKGDTIIEIYNGFGIIKSARGVWSVVNTAKGERFDLEGEGDNAMQSAYQYIDWVSQV